MGFCASLEIEHLEHYNVMLGCQSRMDILRDAWLSQSEEHATFDLRVVSSSPKVDVETTKKK